MLTTTFDAMCEAKAARDASRTALVATLREIDPSKLPPEIVALLAAEARASLDLANAIVAHRIYEREQEAAASAPVPRASPPALSLVVTPEAA